MKFYCLPIAFLLLAGCATVPTIVRKSPNYLAVGSVKGDLKGNSYYMAIGEVDLYRHRAFGGVAAIGRTAESAVGLQVDSSTGRVNRIVTLQPVADETATTTSTLGAVTTTVRTTRRYVLGDLVGGISVIDIHPRDSWLEVLAAMRKATKELGRAGNFLISEQTRVTTTVLPPPFFGWFPRIGHRIDHYHPR